MCVCGSAVVTGMYTMRNRDGTVVEHRENSERLDGCDGACSDGARSDFNHVKRVVVSEGVAHFITALNIRVFPGLGKASIVPEDWTVIVTEFTLIGEGIQLC
jgi:hypothetical protein